MADTTDSAASVAFDPAAPPDERYDANVDLHRSHGPKGLGDLIPPDHLRPVIDYINDSFAEQAMMKAARGGNIVPFPAKGRRERGVQSVTLDDFQIVAQGGYWDRPGLLGFDSMRAMVDQTPILSSIILTRSHQVQRFCQVRSGSSGPGFAIEHVDPTAELGDEQRQSIKLIQQFMTNCGWEADPRRRKRLKRDNFTQFMSKLVRDTLTMDSAPIETEFKRDRSLGLDGLYAIDGATVRLCTEEGYDGDDEVFALQVIQGRIRTAYTYDDLIYEVRNPRTDVTACGYGMGEPEMLVRIVTYLLNAMTYNGSFFDKNSIPRGILHLSGNYDQNDLASFKRYWASMVRGIQNVHNMPVLISKDQESKAEFSEISGQLNEMAFAKWLTFLTSIACAIYGISPEEISMESFAASKSSLSGGDTEEKLEHGADKGLEPLLHYFQNVFSDYVVRPFSEQYVFRFKGLDDESEDRQFERQKLSYTWNEMRALDSIDPIEGPLGDAPMNPPLLSAWQAQQQAAQQAAQQPEEDFGQPPGGDAEGGGDAGAGEEDGDFGAAAGQDGDFGQRAAPPAGGDGEETAKAFGLPELHIYRLDT